MLSDFKPQRNRDASPAIRGYVYQVDLTIMRWLDLQLGQMLELECGEDIDLVTQILENPSYTEERLLEQIKHRETTSLTLKSNEAVSAIVNAVDHYKANKKVKLSFRYTTNAQVASEHLSTILGKKPGIWVWMQLYEGNLQGLEQKKSPSRDS